MVLAYKLHKFDNRIVDRPRIGHLAANAPLIL